MPRCRDSLTGRISVLTSIRSWNNINTALAKNFPDFEFIPALAKGPEEAEKISALDIPEMIDGYIVYQMNCWNRVVQTIAKTGKPVLYVDFQFGGSGGFLVYNSSFLREYRQEMSDMLLPPAWKIFLAAVSCFKLDKGRRSSFRFCCCSHQNTD